MSHNTSKTNQTKIVKVHKRTLRTISNKFSSNYDELLVENRTIKIHQKHLQILMTEVYKIKNQIGPKILWGVCTQKMQPYNLRNSNLLSLPKTNSIKFGTNSITVYPVKLRTQTAFQFLKRKLGNGCA